MLLFSLFKLSYIANNHRLTKFNCTFIILSNSGYNSSWSNSLFTDCSFSSKSGIFIIHSDNLLMVKRY